MAVAAKTGRTHGEMLFRANILRESPYKPEVVEVINAADSVVTAEVTAKMYLADKIADNTALTGYSELAGKG